ncbi:MAG: hypothetical protein R3D78_09945 [Paracoccaceae bacterium]
MLRVYVIAAAVLLAACQPEYLEETPAPVVPAPQLTPPVTTTAGGLEERQPDTCHAADYLSVLGQPSSALDYLAINRPYRIVEWRGFEDQNYNPQRVVFRLDAAGNIWNIDCG